MGNVLQKQVIYIVSDWGSIREIWARHRLQRTVPADEGAMISKIHLWPMAMSGARAKPSPAQNSRERT